MIVKEFQPLNNLVSNYVSKYQLFESSGTYLVKAIPSGTAECWIALEGKFEIFRPEKECFEISGTSGFYPPSRKGFTYYTRDYLRCFNIKLKPTVLGLSAFSNLIQQWDSMSVTSLIGEDGVSIVKKLDFSDNEVVCQSLDELILKTNDLPKVDQRLEQILSSIFQPDNLELRISELAKKNHLTIKSFERMILKYCGMTPKKLMNIIRFGKSSNHFKKNKGAQFIEALEFGYYDQSHFIKECRRITGHSPKEVFSALELITHDMLLFEDDTN